MPIYEFRCRTCAKVFEKFARMSERDTQLSCIYCGANLVDRLISSSSFHLKGGGWAADGYHKSKPQASSGGGA